MSAKRHLNFHGTVSTFVYQFHLSLTGAPVLQCNCNLSLCAWHSSCWKAKPLFVTSSLQPDSTVTQSTICCSLEGMSKSCVTLCHVQLLEPWFRQREKEESMQGESILMFTCVEEDRLQQMTRGSHAGDFLLREEAQRDSSHNLGP